MCPTLDALPVLAVALILMTPMPTPSDGVTVNQDDALLIAVQRPRKGIVTTISCATAVGVNDDVKVRFGAACVTVISLVTSPPLTVIVPLRETESVFDVVFIDIHPLPVPLAGDTDSHEGELLVTVQVQSPTEEIYASTF